MPTQWWREPWRKLYPKLDARWLGLSVSARGLGDELIKYADENGRLFEVSSPVEAGKEIALRLCAKPREYKRIADDTAELLKDTYLVITDGWLLIRNFVDAQERLSPEARRQRAKRERDNARDIDRDKPRDGDSDESVTSPRDSHRVSNRSDPNREDISLARAHARDGWGPTEFAAMWSRITFKSSQAPGQVLIDAAARCRDSAQAAGKEDVAAHAEALIQALPRVIDWLKRSQLHAPALSLSAFTKDEHFARCEDLVAGNLNPDDAIARPGAERHPDHGEPRPRPKPYVAGRYEEP